MKQIALEVVNEGDDFVDFRICHQTHRGEEFGTTSTTFVADNGVCLWSSEYPQVYEDDMDVFVRGDDHSKDDTILTCSEDFFSLLEVAVEEYCQKFSGQDLETKPYSEYKAKYTDDEKSTKSTDLEYYKIVFFDYKGGSKEGYRRVGVIEEDGDHIFGIDLDKENLFDGGKRTYAKEKILGEVYEVKW